MGISLIPSSIRERFVVFERHHATSILHVDFPEEFRDLLGMLEQFTLRRSDILTPGGGKSPISRSINGYFYSRSWREHEFGIRVLVDGQESLAPTHQVDYFRNRVSIETEWNNKDPFFDRDLTTFRLLFELNVLSVGVIITRSAELQRIFDELGKGASYGQSTTHMRKLIPKMENRASGGCPVLAFGILPAAYDPNS